MRTRFRFPDPLPPTLPDPLPPTLPDPDPLTLPDPGSDADSDSFPRTQGALSRRNSTLAAALESQHVAQRARSHDGAPPSLKRRRRRGLGFR